MRAETQAQYIRGQVDDVRRVLDDATGEQRMSVKRIQRKLLAMENKLKDRLDSDRDRGVCFEDTGIDYLIVDEMHMYKNLATESNIRDAAIEGSDRASDLHMKLEYLRSAGRERVVTAATATPISNSITETYVMQRYLRPDVLASAGVGAFDAWAATFGELVTQMEISPTGSTFRMKTRFARFQNGQELLRMWSVFADVKTADDLDLPKAPHGDLSAWADQGVMLLNRVLTVAPGQPASHRGWGWEKVTEHAIRTLVARQTPTGEAAPLVAILWGRDAANLRPLLGETPIIESPHPSPLSAHRGFFGSRPFSRTNELLARRDVAPIEWRLPASA